MTRYIKRNGIQERKNRGIQEGGKGIQGKGGKERKEKQRERERGKRKEKIGQIKRLITDC